MSDRHSQGIENVGCAQSETASSPPGAPCVRNNALKRPRVGDPEFGPVCGCGNAKAKQARTCQPCHSRLRGYGRSMRIRALLEQTSDRKIETVYHGELAVLVAEQQRDDCARFVWDPQTVSLEAVNRVGRRLIDVIPA